MAEFETWCVQGRWCSIEAAAAATAATAEEEVAAPADLIAVAGTWRSLGPGAWQLNIREQVLVAAAAASGEVG
jgi:hypothetical protein